jgi:hypothetical protein
MALVVPNQGEVKLLELALKDATPGNQTLHLFVNDVTPGESDTVATYTEMSDYGYSSKTLTRSNWTVSNVGGVTTASYPSQTFSFTKSGESSATTVYGYYITTNDGTEKLLWAERFANPVIISNTGDEIRLTPKISAE